MSKILEALGLPEDATREKALAALQRLKTNRERFDASRDAPTTADWAKQHASLPASIMKKLKLSVAWTSKDVGDAIAAYLATLDPFRDATVAFTKSEKSDLNLTDAADETGVIARIRSIASTRDTLLAAATPVATFQAKVAEKLKADPKLEVGDAQREVSAEEPELYAVMQAGRGYGQPEFNRFSASRALAEEARRIAKSEGCPIDEAQRRASQRWPELVSQRASGSGEVAR